MLERRSSVTQCLTLIALFERGIASVIRGVLRDCPLELIRRHAWSI